MDVSSPLRVLMLGWEYPPRIAGGLGKASQGIARALAERGCEVLFVLPRYGVALREPGLRVAGIAAWLKDPGVDAPRARLRRVALPARLLPYAGLPPQSGGFMPPPRREEDGRAALYGADLGHEVARYARQVLRLAARIDADVIHAHDWMSFPAACALAEARGWPLCVHVHSTEYDRGGGGADPRIEAIERAACHAAARVFAVSAYTRAVLIERYGVDPARIAVVHNAPEDAPPRVLAPQSPRPPHVVFLGRLALQKGPEHFLRAAAEVAAHDAAARFLVCGEGDLRATLEALARELGIAARVEFRGFLDARAVRRVLETARVLVMPSVSEPFGLVALEALQSGTPVILSRQSGVREVLDAALEADYWDHEALADAILAVLRHPALARQVVAEGLARLHHLSWEQAAQRILEAYAAIPVRGAEHAR